MKANEYKNEAKLAVIKENPFLADKKLRFRFVCNSIYIEVYSEIENRYFDFSKYNYIKKTFQPLS